MIHGTVSKRTVFNGWIKLHDQQQGRDNQILENPGR